MGYESEPLPYYLELRNCFYSIKLITSLPRLFIRLINRVLISPSHHPACTQNPLRLHEKFIDRPAGHPIRYIHMSSLNVYSNGVDPCRVYCLLYRWILPLSACPTFCRHPRDLVFLCTVSSGTSTSVNIVQSN